MQSTHKTTQLHTYIRPTRSIRIYRTCAQLVQPHMHWLHVACKLHQLCHNNGASVIVHREVCLCVKKIVAKMKSLFSKVTWQLFWSDNLWKWQTSSYLQLGLHLPRSTWAFLLCAKMIDCNTWKQFEHQLIMINTHKHNVQWWSKSAYKMKTVYRPTAHRHQNCLSRLLNIHLIYSNFSYSSFMMLSMTR